MIPDFPREKEKLMEIFNSYLVDKINELLGFWCATPKHVNHEGDKWKLIRSDGTGEIHSYNTVEGLMTIQKGDVSSLTSDTIREKLDEIANNMVRQITQKMFEEIERVTHEVGNEINANGQSLSPNLFLQMLEKIDMTFDEKEDWNPPTMFISPEMWEANKENFQSWENDKEFLAKRDEIIRRKKEEWRDRENCRKLVD